MKRSVLLLLMVLIGFATSAQAHSVWINAFESHEHHPPHAMVSIGWGHTMPMDDILNSTNARIAIDRFELFDPRMRSFELQKPNPEEAEPALSTEGFDVFAGDLAVQKIALKDDSAHGVYQFGVVSQPTFYTQYIDAKGRQRLKLKPKDELQDAEKILVSIKYQAFAKSCVTVGEWTAPKPLGHGLEIIPLTDLSTLHAGDMVQVQVLFYGEPLETTAKSIEYITAHSPGFGQSDGFSLFSYVQKGTAQFRVQSAGQWMINIYHKDEVTEDGPLNELFGKTDRVYHSASLTFNVQ